jgi:DNA-binding LytR/AlgR family response regulator
MMVTGDDMDILYVKIVNRKIVIVTVSGVITGSLTRQLEHILTMFGFVKVDKSKFAYMHMAESFSFKDSKITFYGGKQCVVSRRNMKKISAFFDKKGL